MRMFFKRIDMKSAIGMIRLAKGGWQIMLAAQRNGASTSYIIRAIAVPIPLHSIESTQRETDAFGQPGRSAQSDLNSGSTRREPSHKRLRVQMLEFYERIILKGGNDEDERTK